MRKTIALAAALLCLPLAGLRAQSDTLYVSTLFTTHVIFTSDVTYADRSSSTSIASKIVEQNKNMIAVKAREPFADPCSISALESSGRMWTFIVVYRENPDRLIVDTRGDGGGPEGGARQSGRRGGRGDSASASTWKEGTAPDLSEVLGRRRSLHHIVTSGYGLEVSCDNIFSYSDVTYFTVTVKNRSGISYEVADATFVIESRRRGRRTVAYDQPVFPKSRHGGLSASPSGEASVVYSFDKLTLSSDQVLKVYLYETGGQRNLVLSVTPEDINRARQYRR